jgi:hypothetical protein
MEDERRSRQHRDTFSERLRVRDLDFVGRVR